MKPEAEVMKSINILSFCIIALLAINYSQGLVKIELEDRTVNWSGCMYKKISVMRTEIPECIECAKNGKRLARFWFGALTQNYINCSTPCHKPTICTEYKYNIDGIWRSECYQCENGDKEDIKFRFVRSYKICSQECKKCALGADLSTANHCAFVCQGNPTFCYPKEMFFGHRKCYHATKMYGCNYVQVDPIEIADLCKDCALSVDQKDSQYCTGACEGVPHYHTVENGKRIILQCQLGFYHELFEHEIPNSMMYFLKIENPMLRSRVISFPKYQLGRSS